MLAIRLRPELGGLYVAPVLFPTDGVIPQEIQLRNRVLLSAFVVAATTATTLTTQALVAAPSAEATTSGSSYISLAPTRLADSRTGLGGAGTTPLQVGETRNITLAGRAGIPTSGVDAVQVDIEVINPTTATSLTVYPAGTTRPETSAINAKAGASVSNTLITKLGTNGAISIYSTGGPEHFIIDVQGYFAPSSAGGFIPVKGARMVDTRDGTGGFYSALPAGGTMSVQLRDRAPIGPDASSMFGNVTITGSSANGFVTAYASGTARPGTSSVNYTAGTTAGATNLPLGSDGAVNIYNGGSVAVHVVIDAQGYFTTGTHGGGLTAVQGRLYDSRLVGALQPGEVRELQIGGTQGIPADAPLSSAMVNLQAVSPSAPGHLKVWPRGEDEPDTSAINFQANWTRSNVNITAIGDRGYVIVKNDSAGTVTLVVDLQGWFSAPAPSVDNGDGTTTFQFPAAPDECAAMGQSAGCFSEVTTAPDQGGAVPGLRSMSDTQEGSSLYYSFALSPGNYTVNAWFGARGVYKVRRTFSWNFNRSQSWVNSGEQNDCYVSYAYGVSIDIQPDTCRFTGSNPWNGKTGAPLRAEVRYTVKGGFSIPASFTKRGYVNLYPSGHMYVRLRRV